MDYSLVEKTLFVYNSYFSSLLSVTHLFIYFVNWYTYFAI